MAESNRRSKRRRRRLPPWLGLQLQEALCWPAAALVGASARAVGFVVAGVALFFVVVGVYRLPFAQGPLGSGAQQVALATLVCLCAVLLLRLFEHLRNSVAGSSSASREVELGTLFIASVFAVIELSGGPSGLLYPLVFALVAFLVAFFESVRSAFFVSLIIAVELATTLYQPQPGALRLFASHTSFNLLFAFLYATFLRSELQRGRMALRAAIDGHLASIASDGRDFRLTCALSLDSRDLSADELERRRLVGSVQAIRDSIYNLLAVAERALKPRTIALYWLDEGASKFGLKELRARSDDVCVAKIGALDGLLGVLHKRPKPLVLTHLRPSHPGLVYYERPPHITDFVGVPVLEGAAVRGVLLADRDDARPFADSEVEFLQTVALEVLRAVEVECLFAQMDQEKYQRERFYQASRAFNTALTLSEVAGAAIAAVQRVAKLDFMAVAVAGDHAHEMVIAGVVPQEGEGLLGRVFRIDQGLIGAAIKARHVLPHGALQGGADTVFGEGVELPASHVKVIPLLWKNSGVGAFILGSNGAVVLGDDQLAMARVIADHAAIAIANAQMYARMERMATTDGLTGVTNHRHFQALFDSTLARAERYGGTLSLLLTDIDYFKTINDTYGHPVGDKVLVRVAEILSGTARRIDVVARYGGEEFAVLMGETSKEGALQMAERIRLAVEQELFRCENGTFRCTLSIGIATFPDDGAQKAKITECADQALYEAKRRGRNQTVVFRSHRTKAAG